MVTKFAQWYLDHLPGRFVDVEAHESKGYVVVSPDRAPLHSRHKGARCWSSTEKHRRDSGILMHCVGPDKVWMKSIECQIQEHDCGDFHMVGGTTITLKVTDPSGDFSEDTVSVNIVDTTDPLITAPPNVSVNTGPGASSSAGRRGGRGMSCIRAVTTPPPGGPTVRRSRW